MRINTWISPLIFILLLINIVHFFVTRDALKENYTRIEIERELWEEPCYLKDGHKIIGTPYINRLGYPGRFVAYMFYEEK